MKQSPQKTLELLSPAGNMEALVAAVQNGADAVYFGGQILNARRNAANFDGDDFYKAVEYCHERNVKAYITVNTLLKNSEVKELCAFSDTMLNAGIDAAIVQDLGVINILKNLCPDLPLHASTQMSITNASGVQVAKEIGLSRVVLARECSYEEITLCANKGIEIEAFVHGALCVSYSGQCLFSSMLGGRSGNRGLCAQPCRQLYELSGAHNAKGYLLSPKDLMGLDQLKNYIDSGVHCIKIEGRLKRPEYVAVVTKIYREALDLLDGGKSIDIETSKKELLKIFNRGGFTSGYGDFKLDKEIMAHHKPNNWGLPIGEIIAKRGGKAILKTYEDIEAGDSIEVRGLMDDGCMASQSIKAGGELALDIKSANISDKAYKTNDVLQLQRARESYAGENKLIDVQITARIITGEPARLEITDGISTGFSVGEIVQGATNKPLTEDKVKAQLSKLGDTVYNLTSCQIELSADAFMPLSLLNSLRREAAINLTQKRLLLSRGNGGTKGAMPTIVCDKPILVKPILLAETTRLYDAKELLSAGADYVIFSPPDLTLETIKQIPDNTYVSIPSILNSNELAELYDAIMVRASIRGVVLNNLSHFAYKWPGTIIAGAPLNCFNQYSYDILIQLGANYVVPSLEMNAAQIKEMHAVCPNLMLTVYGKATLMTLSHCPLLAVQGTNLDHDACRQCDLGKGLCASKLTDKTGASFPFTRYRGKSGCYIKVLNSLPLSIIKKWDALPKTAGYIVNLTDEDKSLALEIITAYKGAIDGKKFGDELKFPSTNGHYFRGVE